MSNWGWPQWVMAIWIVIGFVGNICIEVGNSQRTVEELTRDAVKKKLEWQYRTAIYTTLLIIKWIILAKGGFWG